MPQQGPIMYSYVSKHSIAARTQHVGAYYQALSRLLSSNASKVIFVGAAPKSLSRFSIIQRASSAAAFCSIHSSSMMRTCFPNLSERFRDASSKSCSDIKLASSRNSIGVPVGSRISNHLTPQAAHCDTNRPVDGIDISMYQLPASAILAFALVLERLVPRLSL